MWFLHIELSTIIHVILYYDNKFIVHISSDIFHKRIKDTEANYHML